MARVLRKLIVSVLIRRGGAGWWVISSTLCCRWSGFVDALLLERDHLEVSEDGVGSSANADGRDRAMRGLQLFAHPTTQRGGMAARIERACGTAFRVSLADLKYRNWA